MIQYDRIEKLHLELTTRCNSVCPDCPRNLRGVEIIDNYPLCQLTLDQIQQLLSPVFLQQIRRVLINGNYGDFVAARDALDIVQYIKNTNPLIELEISTNGSAQPKIWAPLGELDVTVRFRLDGMADTHHLYRQNTDWHAILDHAQQFIRHGGHAIWSMIVFDHNKHQIEQCRALSQELGFQEFDCIDLGPAQRNVFPVFTKEQTLSHVVGDYRGPRDWQSVYSGYVDSCQRPELELEYVTDRARIDCAAKKHGHEIYIAANGEVYPCCWTGFYPTHNQHSWTNRQLAPLVKENNALVYGIEHAIAWFSAIERTWAFDSVKAGRILACNENCGRAA
jgi:MoaA/NifB/PqqE/SkfB family radical SAM enzyme